MREELKVRFAKETHSSKPGVVTLGKFKLEYPTLTPQEEAALREQAEGWVLVKKIEEKVDHDEYGKYDGDNREYRTTLTDIHSFTTGGWGDIIAEGGRVVGVIISTPDGYCILKTGGTVKGAAQGSYTVWESRAVRYCKYRYSLEKKK